MEATAASSYAVTSTAPLPPGKTQGSLSHLGFSVIIAGNESTCKTSSDSSLLDSILCDRDITNLIGDLELETSVDWAPHSAVKFSINRRPEFVKTQQLAKPKPLPYLLNHFGQLLPWSIGQAAWDWKLQDAEAAAKAAITRKDDSNGIWQHADSLNITAESEARAIRYA